uniref:Uncharacterized protein n=1 Tax=Oryza glumipatula TaxID=40148 RepID=A0A0E0AZT2_9ORYZ
MMTGEGNKLVFLDNAPEAVIGKGATGTTSPLQLRQGKQNGLPFLDIEAPTLAADEDEERRGGGGEVVGEDDEEEVDPFLTYI